MSSGIEFSLNLIYIIYTQIILISNMSFLRNSFNIKFPKNHPRFIFNRHDYNKKIIYNPSHSKF